MGTSEADLVADHDDGRAALENGRQRVGDGTVDQGIDLEQLVADEGADPQRQAVEEDDPTGLDRAQGGREARADLDRRPGLRPDTTVTGDPAVELGVAGPSRREVGDGLSPGEGRGALQAEAALAAPRAAEDEDETTLTGPRPSRGGSPRTRPPRAPEAVAVEGAARPGQPPATATATIMPPTAPTSSPPSATTAAAAARATADIRPRAPPRLVRSANHPPLRFGPPVLGRAPRRSRERPANRTWREQARPAMAGPARATIEASSDASTTTATAIARLPPHRP
jgi:hypothetical protein